MMVRSHYIKKFEDLRLNDVGLVGGKNASLGEMIGALSQKGIRVPQGFAITADAYWYLVKANKLLDKLKACMVQCTKQSTLEVLQKAGKQARTLIEQATIPEDLAQEICAAYKELSALYNVQEADVAVRSSATAEDSPQASFAGQQDTFLNIRGSDYLLQACKKSMASLFTDRAIGYRFEKGFDHFKMALSVGVQKMVRSDLATAGVAFSLDTESGFKDVVVINASYGLAENLVQGLITPDEFIVHKPTLQQGFKPLIKKQLGNKQTKKIYNNDPCSPLIDVSVAPQDQVHFSLTDDEILELAHYAITIEQHYSEQAGHWMPMDIEWAKDGIDKKLYLIQARPETVHAVAKKEGIIEHYVLKEGDKRTLQQRLLVTGQSIGQHMVSGKAHRVTSLEGMVDIKEGEILITTMTNPDWVPIMKKAAGIITERGGRTCHAAIVSRELGVPALVGAEGALTKIRDGQMITIDGAHGQMGFVYDGAIPFSKELIALSQVAKPTVDLMVNIALPDHAFSLSFLPVDGVGLARIEFIIAHSIQIHPMALLYPERLGQKDCTLIASLTAAYPDFKTYFIEMLAQGVGTIAAAFYPRPVFVRFSDFKTNEYRELIGGALFEPVEANPMLGFRGASRYYHERYQAAFELECVAMKKVRETMGFSNVKLLIPFIRTVEEGKRVLQVMAGQGLKRGDKDFEVYMMCEIPGEIVMLDEYSQLFDGFSIGSNDLTQMTLSVDRDSELLMPLFKENAPEVKKFMALAIKTAHQNKKYVSICGQAPSDYPEIADFLIQQGIDAISLNTDSVIPFLIRIAKLGKG
jgi:pyruvate,water dikinase